MNEYLYLYAVIDIFKEFTDKKVNTAILFQWDRDDEKTIYQCAVIQDIEGHIRFYSRSCGYSLGSFFSNWNDVTMINDYNLSLYEALKLNNLTRDDIIEKVNYF